MPRRASYAGDTFSAGISGYIDDEADEWQIGAGATAGLGDMATISVAAAIGDDADFEDIAGDYGDYWGASIYGRLDVTEQTYVEASYGFLDAEGSTCSFTGFLCPVFNDFTRQVFDVGIYHSPVDQLVFGLEANYEVLSGDDDDFDFDLDDDDGDADDLRIAFISWFNL